MEQSSSPKNNAAETVLCRLYVRNISRTSTTEGVTKYFEKFGHLTDVSLIMEPTTGQNKGFAFITFENDKNVDDCLLCTTHTLDDRELEVRRVMPKSIPDPLLQTKTSRIFLGGLPHGVSEQDIIDFFNGKYSKLGEVKEVIVKKERQSGRPRGFCFVEFTSYHVVDKIVTDNRFPVIMNKKCEVRKADTTVPITGAPPSALPISQQNGNVRNGPMPHRASGYENSGRYGGSRFGSRNDGPPYHPHHAGGSGSSHPYGGSMPPAYDDAPGSMGGYGGYYNSYSSYGGGAGSYSQPSYGGSSQPPMDRPYSSYGAPPPSAGYGSGYDSQPVAGHRQQQPMYGAPAASSAPNTSQGDYGYSASTGYGSNPQSGTAGSAQTSGGPHASYGMSQAPPTQQPGSSNYGASYGHGASVVGQTVAYPTRSYRPQTGSAQSVQGSVGMQAAGTAPGSQHRPPY